MHPKTHLATLKGRERLSCPKSGKDTHHVELNLDGLNLTYEAGDCIGVIPVNYPEIVEKTLDAMEASGDQTIVYKEEALPLHEVLTHKVNLSKLPKGLFKAVAGDHPLLEDRKALSQHLEERELWDLLHEHRPVDPQAMCDKLTALLPRYYSIASSMEEVGNEVHLTVRHLKYTSREIRRLGVCTHYLCELAKQGDQVPIFIHHAPHFKLPAGDLPIIMIGPGTGVAPYRGFMQERLASGATGKNWLFFGEWTRNGHFFYEDFWLDLEKKGLLRLDVAFSRDQAHKVYVQDKVREAGEEIWRWLQEGAVIYLCGDAKGMAPGVEKALQEILSRHMPTEETKGYLKALRKAGRYQKDVY